MIAEAYSVYEDVFLSKSSDISENIYYDHMYTSCASLSENYSDYISMLNGTYIDWFYYYVSKLKSRKESDSENSMLQQPKGW